MMKLLNQILFQVRSPPVSPPDAGHAGGVERVRGRHRRLHLPGRRAGLHRSAGGTFISTLSHITLHIGY